MDALIKKPWWKRRRAWAAVALWLLVWYPLSFGPTWYVINSGRMPPSAMPWISRLYRPYLRTVNLLDGDSAPYRVVSEYHGFWGRLGERHRAASD